jgi:hypothetical protein
MKASDQTYPNLVCLAPKKPQSEVRDMSVIHLVNISFW